MASIRTSIRASIGTAPIRLHSLVVSHYDSQADASNAQLFFLFSPSPAHLPRPLLILNSVLYSLRNNHRSATFFSPFSRWPTDGT